VENDTAPEPWKTGRMGGVDAIGWVSEMSSIPSDFVGIRIGRGREDRQRRDPVAVGSADVRILVASLPGFGHLLPLLPLARAAAGAGHDVVVGTGDRLANVVGHAGLRHEPMGQEIAAARAAFPELDALPLRAMTEAMWRHVFPGTLAETMTRDALAFGRSWTPDVVVHEDCDLGSWIAAEVLGVPHVTVQVTAWRPWLLAIAAERLDDLTSAHGLPADPRLERMHRYRFLTTRPRSIRAYEAPYPATTQELRPVADNVLDGDAAPTWLATRGDRPRIAVTFGTVHLDRIDLALILEALADLPVEVVVALGADPASAGPVPGNVRVEAYVPMSALLPTCSVVISHGGSGTMAAALAAGVPLITIPLAADQADNADSLAAAGVGVTIERDELSPDRLRRAIEATEDRAMRSRVEAVRGEVEAMPPPEEVLRGIEDLVGT
jgi:UDP:flavonoid glycosyltransferase YjiC (YdhE family)